MSAARNVFLLRVGLGAIEVEGESPEREGGGEDVGVSERALREPDWIDRGENDGDCGD